MALINLKPVPIPLGYLIKCGLDIVAKDKAINRVEPYTSPVLMGQYEVILNRGEQAPNRGSHRRVRYENLHWFGPLLKK